MNSAGVESTHCPGTAGHRVGGTRAGGHHAGSQIPGKLCITVGANAGRLFVQVKDQIQPFAAGSAVQQMHHSAAGDQK